MELPRNLVDRWKQANMEGKLALQACSSLFSVAESDRAPQWYERKRLALGKLESSVVECGAACDALCDWKEQMRGDAKVNVGLLECLSVQIEAFEDETTMRHLIVAGLQKEERGHQACLVSWKLTPFLAGERVEQAKILFKGLEALEDRLEQDRRHGSHNNSAKKKR